ncbi:MAG: GDSL-type esterase/lipase family protein [Fibrobacterota bacterium]
MKQRLSFFLILILAFSFPLVSDSLKGGSGTNIDYYCAEFTQEMVDHLKDVHANWNQSWNKYRVAVLGNSITNQNIFWEPLSGDVSGITNAGAINSFKDSTFNRNGWTGGSSCKGSSQGNYSGWTIKQVHNSLTTVIQNDKPMIAAIMIGTNNIQQNHSPSSNCYENNDGSTIDCYPDTFEVNEIIDDLEAAGIMPFLTTIPPIDFDHNTWIRENRQAKLDQYNADITAYAVNNNIPIVKLYEWAADHGPVSDLLSDWAHPSSCSDGNSSLSDNCLDGGSSGGLQNARHYLYIMAINDIVRYVIDNEPLDVDATAPAAISDLSAAPGQYSGTVDLSWTAVGDDGTSGTAGEYDIRYSTSTITEANFSSASVFGAGPSPSVAGASESTIVTGLNPGTVYYFAIKASDGTNSSTISNVASAEATSGGSGADSIEVSVTADTYLERGSGVKGSNQFVRLKKWSQGVMCFDFDVSSVPFTPDSAVIILTPADYISPPVDYHIIARARPIYNTWSETTLDYSNTDQSLDDILGATSYTCNSLAYMGDRDAQTEYRFGVSAEIIQELVNGNATGIAIDNDQALEGNNNDFFAREHTDGGIPRMMIYTGLSTSIEKNKASAPEKALLTASPNPFNPSTSIAFRPSAGRTVNSLKISVYSADGRLIDVAADISSADFKKGYSVTWNAEGRSAGLYIVKAVINGEKEYTSKLMLVK